MPPPFTPLGNKAGEGANAKSSSTVARTETSMETDAVAAPEVHRRPPVPQPHPALQKEDNEPHIVDEAGMSKWSNDMLKGHLGGRASSCEQWGNSFALQFKRAIDTMSHLLRIKEDSYVNMFADKERVLKESNENLEKIKTLEKKLASLTMHDDNVKKLKLITLSYERN